jgi:molybdenum cofactor cytidylyltransferase
VSGGGIVGILLAAGRASRFGADKLLHPLPDGMPLAVRSGRNLIAALPRTLAVTRRDQKRLSELLRGDGLETVVCAAADDGMGASLACGVAAAADAAGWVIGLADMPYVRPGTIKRIACALVDGAAIAVPVFDGRRGNPVGFAQRYRHKLCCLSGDTGGRAILAAEPHAVVLIDCEDPGVLRDIDAPSDLAAADAAMQCNRL